MEAHPATTQDLHPALGESIPRIGDQVPNDCGQRDRTRDQRGKPCRKRLKVLDNPQKLAFRGWIDVPEPWTFEHCKQYIEWCHVGKAFKRDWYLAHHSVNKANLKFCENPDFLGAMHPGIPIPLSQRKGGSQRSHIQVVPHGMG